MSEAKDSQSQYKLMYWPIPGRAEVTRHMFVIRGVKFDDFRYPRRNEQFRSDQASGKFPWGGVPVLEVDGTPIGQTHAIERFVARRLNFLGANDVEAAVIDSFCEAMVEVKGKYKALGPRPGSDPNVKEQVADFFSGPWSNFLDKIDAFLEKSTSGYLVGKEMSLADLRLYILFGFFDDQETVQKLIDERAHVKKFFELMDNDEGINKWRAERPAVTEKKPK